MIETANKQKNWFNTTFPVNWDVLKEFSNEAVPCHLKRWWFALGGTPAYLLVIQVITGMLLTFFYVPSATEAYDSVAHLTHNVPYGWYIRGIHKWAGHFFIVSLMLHMCRVFFTASYRKPRELNWMIGVGLFLTSLILGFTGYSLVYDQISYWAVVVGTNIAEATPFVGESVARFMRGGDGLSQNTLTRFFVLHVGVLPTVILVLVGMHVLQIRLHGVSVLDPKDLDKKDRYFPFIPDHILTEFTIGISLFFLLTILTLVFPPEMGERANPNVTPSHIKPEWFFFFTFRWLKLVPFNVGIIGNIVLAVSVIFWPFIDRGIERRFPKKDIYVYIGIVSFLIFLSFTVWEAVV